jgi:uncharacterized iron-regulated membrane protein
MSHGTHAVQHEVEHKIKHEDAHHGHKDLLDSRNKKIALLISVIALFLALSETMGKSQQTSALSLNIEAANLWAFFQAKTIRITTLRTAADTRKIDIEAAQDPAIKASMTKQIDGWTRTAARYEDEADPPEGRKQLMARALDAEKKRDTALAKYHHYEVASAAFQIGIVLASATVITGMVVLSWLAGGLALVGIGFMGIALFAPHAVHLF